MIVVDKDVSGDGNDDKGLANLYDGRRQTEARKSQADSTVIGKKDNMAPLPMATGLTSGNEVRFGDVQSEEDVDNIAECTPAASELVVRYCISRP